MKGAERRLVYSWKTEDGWMHRYVTWEEAFRVKNPICPKCRVEVPRTPSGIDGYEGWSGEFHCLKCGEMIAVIHYEKQ